MIVIWWKLQQYFVSMTSRHNLTQMKLCEMVCHRVKRTNILTLGYMYSLHVPNMDVKPSRKSDPPNKTNRKLIFQIFQGTKKDNWASRPVYLYFTFDNQGTFEAILSDVGSGFTFEKFRLLVNVFVEMDQIAYIIIVADESVISFWLEYLPR